MGVRRLEQYIKPNIIIYMLLLGGFLIGMVISFAGSKGMGTMELLWLDSTIMYLKYGEIQYLDMLFYIIKKRLGTILLLLLLCMSGKGKYFLLGGVALAGCFLGFFVSEFIISKGIMGSIFLFISLFPHYLYYIFAYYQLLKYVQSIGDIKTNINRFGQQKTKNTTADSYNIIKKLSPIAVVIIGILLECYVNPFFLKIFLKFFM